MYIIVSENLSAIVPLKKENIQIEPRTATYRDTKDFLKIAILNLMPTKHSTEAQLLRLLNNDHFSIDAEFIYLSSHKSKTTSEEYVRKNYKSFDEIKNQKWDGMIITGAPVEHLEFEEVDHWEELKKIMDWTRINVNSTFYICWGAQAALYHFHQIPKYKLSEKMFGVFHHNIKFKAAILKDFQDPFLAPHSRHTEIRRKDIEKVVDLKIISESDEAGIHMVMDECRKELFVTGHSEYDLNTMKDEYFRDINKGSAIKKPCNYFPEDDETLPPMMTWQRHARLLFNNWLKYYVKPINLSDLVACRHKGLEHKSVLTPIQKETMLTVGQAEILTH